MENTPVQNACSIEGEKSYSRAYLVPPLRHSPSEESLWLFWCDETFLQVGTWILSACLRSCSFLEFLSPCYQIVFSQADAGQKPWGVPCDQPTLPFLKVPTLRECQPQPPEPCWCLLCSVKTQGLLSLHSQGHNPETTHIGIIVEFFSLISPYQGSQACIAGLQWKKKKNNLLFCSFYYSVILYL